MEEVQEHPCGRLETSALAIRFRRDRYRIFCALAKIQFEYNNDFQGAMRDGTWIMS